MAVIWFVIVAIGAWSAVSVRRERRADLVRLNATRPETVTLGSEGLTFRPPGGQITIRWADVKKWRERGRVVCLDGTGDQVFIFSVAALTGDQRHAIRNLLRSVVPTSN